jgi:hypothetical protein
MAHGRGRDPGMPRGGRHSQWAHRQRVEGGSIRPAGARRGGVGGSGESQPMGETIWQRGGEWACGLANRSGVWAKGGGTVGVALSP